MEFYLSGGSPMFYKPLWFLILSSFINYTFIGCSTVRIRQLYEIQPNDKIRNAFTSAGEKIRFDNKGGFHYALEEPGIAGIMKSGDWIVFRMRDIKEIHKTSPEITKSKKLLRNQKITEVITLNYDLVRFDSASGIYDDSDKTIKGINTNGIKESYKLKSLTGARIVAPDIISMDSLMRNKDASIAEIVTNDQKLIIFDRLGGMFVEASNVLVGYTMKGSLVRLDGNQIETVYVDHPFSLGTFIIGSSLAGLILYFGLIIPLIRDAED